MRTKLLEKALLELLHELKDTDVNLIIGGGYGILLRVEDRKQSGIRTLYSSWPQERTTGDIDLFLRPELLINSKQLEPLRTAFNKLGYKPIESAKFFQFAKMIPGLSPKAELKFDLLTGPQDVFDGTTVKADARRAKPRHPKIGIHARPTNEAITLEKNLHQLQITGNSNDGRELSGVVFLPNTFTFLMMKLYAFRDRYEGKEKEFGIYHALDIYSILATTTEAEWGTAKELREFSKENQYYKGAVSIVENLFSSKTSKGITRLQESKYYNNDFELDNFIRNLKELFY